MHRDLNDLIVYKIIFSRPVTRKKAVQVANKLLILIFLTYVLQFVNGREFRVEIISQFAASLRFGYRSGEFFGRAWMRNNETIKGASVLDLYRGA
jgi:hypothetical protein